MRSFFAVLLTIALFPFSGNAQVKTAPNPVHWQFSVKKMDNNLYRFEAKATIDKGYHIFAQDPGGDGTLIPTSFTAEQLSNGGWVGDWKEESQPKVEKIPELGDAIRYHEKAVIFFRDFKAKYGDKVKGAVQYQSCNEEMCFPPAIENFIVAVP